MASNRPKLGVRLPNSGPFANADVLLRAGTHAEELGFDRVWVHDHISWPKDKLTHFATGSLEACVDQDPNFFESMTTSALLLGRLRRIGVGIAGLVVPLRDPRILAKQLATMEVLGESRLTVALAIGAIRGDFEVMGVPFERRGRITNDYLAALRTILDGDQPTGYEGTELAFRDGTFLPRPRSLAMWITGSSDAGLRRAVRFGDGWMTVYQPVEAYRAFVEQLAAISIELGHASLELDTGYETYVAVARTHEDALAIARRSLEGKFESLDRGLEVCIVGDPGEVLEKIDAYGVAGARHVELKFIAHDPEQLLGMMTQTAEAAGLAPRRASE